MNQSGRNTNDASNLGSTDNGEGIVDISSDNSGSTSANSGTNGNQNSGKNAAISTGSKKTGGIVGS